MSSDQQQIADAASSRSVNEPLRQELLRMQDADQAMRTTIARKYPPGTPLSGEDVAWWQAVDTGHTERMKQIIAGSGWPGQSLVGADGAVAAWLLVQHADRDRDFQRQCLPLLQAAVTAGEARAQELAYLTDRVCVGEDRSQVYGTQMTLVDGELKPYPIEDEAHVDERRAEVGLGPLADYIARMKDHERSKE
jgi:hypothetical protein